jgi:hypothetical protein
MEEGAWDATRSPCPAAAARTASHREVRHWETPRGAPLGDTERCATGRHREVRHWETPKGAPRETQPGPILAAAGGWGMVRCSPRRFRGDRAVISQPLPWIRATTSSDGRRCCAPVPSRLRPWARADAVGLVADPCRAGRPWKGPAAPPGVCCGGWCEAMANCRCHGEQVATEYSCIQQVFEALSTRKSVDPEVASIEGCDSP